MKKILGIATALFLVMGVAGGSAVAQESMHNPCNPCAMKKMNPCNPCAMKNMKDHNPCSMKYMKKINPCNPCSMKHGSKW